MDRNANAVDNDCIRGCEYPYLAGAHALHGREFVEGLGPGVPDDDPCADKVLACEVPARSEDSKGNDCQQNDDDSPPCSARPCSMQKEMLFAALGGLNHS